MHWELSANLHNSDGDPRKLVAVRHLVQQFPQAIAYWHRSGITERTAVENNRFGAHKHKYGALAHMFSEAIYADTICSLLHVNSSLVILAALLHDADKPIDMKLIQIALDQNNHSWEKIRSVIDETYLEDKSIIQNKLEKDFRHYFNNPASAGERVHVARSLIGSIIHCTRLAQYGFPPEVIAIQGVTEYSGCDAVDYLMDNYDRLTNIGKDFAAQKIVMAYVDICMDESQLTDPQKRTETVFSKKYNIALDEDYRNWNSKGETAKEKQTRVGYKLQEFLAKSIGFKSNDFQSELISRVQAKLSSV